MHPPPAQAHRPARGCRLSDRDQHRPETCACQGGPPFPISSSSCQGPRSCPPPPPPAACRHVSPRRAPRPT
eukprot:5587027-Prymnesium_polylepis.1